MKPDLESLVASVPDIDREFVQTHLERLGPRYFERFDQDDIAKHIRLLSSLDQECPVELVIEQKDETVVCTVLSYDYVTVFALITGILAATGFEILSGDVFTYKRIYSKHNTAKNNTKKRGWLKDKYKKPRRMIIDCFKGYLDTPLSFEQWQKELKRHMQNVFRLLEAGDPETIAEARHLVNELVVNRLGQVHGDSPPVLYPVNIEIDNEVTPYTCLIVRAVDTPAFLYSLSNALSSHGISIEHVRIRTIGNRVEDEIYLLDSKGNKIEDPHTFTRVKLSVLLTKQFTYFLCKAPDPYAALSRFERLVDDLIRLPEKGKWVELLTNPHTLEDLAKLLGTSDYLWEDFIRLQYETLLPMLKPHVRGKRFSTHPHELPAKIEKALADARGFEQKVQRLNQFKDQEIFLIDLDHILNPDSDFRSLAESLTMLAENIIRKATQLVYQHLNSRYGIPRTVGGLEARLAVMGLGKLGGAALGYASDIELLFVYSDNGQTDGPEPITNAEFFDRLVREVNRSIHAKQEGIFQIDLRLRPYGNSGPLACSLENFWKYYGPGGPAHSYERLALVRMRAIAGDKELGRRLERLRNELLYSTKSIDLRELRELREKQFKEKTKKGLLNAKFSPGGLVDVEYGVQILQVIYGRDIDELRTPKLHEALRALAQAGVLSDQEAIRLIQAYDFLRDLINCMRMLKGSGKDLFLPPIDSDEFDHLARRMGYVRGEALEPAEQLRIDFESHTAAVRAFLERHFGRDSVPGSVVLTVADLVLSESIPQQDSHKVLSEYGFADPARAFVNLKSLSGEGNRRDTFARLSVIAFDIISRTPDPDMALNNWERFIRAVASPEFHFSSLLSQPMRLEILLKVFSSSQFLSDTLIRNPEFLDWIMIPEVLHGVRTREEMENELRQGASTCRTHSEWLNKLRRFRRREILRIGTRDICLQIPTTVIMQELSSLAEAFVQVSLEVNWKRLMGERSPDFHKDNERERFCIMALGKLGGRELNYSSDIDLLAVCGQTKEISAYRRSQQRALYGALMEKIAHDLSVHTEEGYAYRVDLRLRPFGSSGELVQTSPRLIEYYKKSAALWEIQAALKMRPVAGDVNLGEEIIDKLIPILRMQRSADIICKSVEDMRKKALKERSGGFAKTMDVKVDLGGLRDVEFLVQGLQLAHLDKYPDLVEGNTLNAIEALMAKNIIQETFGEELKADYLFLRRLEHLLQILEDRQVHALPEKPQQVEALAKRLLGEDAKGRDLLEALDRVSKRIRAAYVSVTLEKKFSMGNDNL